MSNFAFLNKDFHPAFSRIAEIRAIVPSVTPLMDCTATETRIIQEESVSTLKCQQSSYLQTVLTSCTWREEQLTWRLISLNHSAPELSENRLFGMFHASTPQHSKDVIMGSLQDCHGTVRVVFASVAITWSRYNHPLWCSKQY